MALATLISPHCCGATYLDLAAEIEETLISEYGVDIWKALDPLNDRDFVIMFTRLKRELERKSKPIEIEAVVAALAILDVDWPKLTDAQRAAVAKAANKAILKITTNRKTGIPSTLESVFVDDHLLITGKTRSSVKTTYQFEINVALDKTDKSIANNAAKSQSTFITDEYGARAVSVEEKVRKIVATGLNRGLGRDEIARMLENEIPAAILGRSASYWNIVSASFMNRARTSAQLDSFARAEIDTYIFDAVLDRQTTEQCRFLHGKQWSVENARKQMRESDQADDPLDLKNSEPWMQEGKDSNGKRILYIKGRDGVITVIADVLKAGRGKNDRVGVYKQHVSDAQLAKMGIPWPPLHGL